MMGSDASKVGGLLEGERFSAKAAEEKMVELSETYSCTLTPISLSRRSNLVFPARVSCELRPTCISTCTYLEAASTKRQPPAYISHCLFFPNPVNKQPGEEQTKWSTKTRCPGWRMFVFNVGEEEKVEVLWILG